MNNASEQAVEQRLAALEKRQAELESRLVGLHDEIAENTRMTLAIKTDTAQIVTLFKASILGANIIKWVAAIGSAMIVAYAALKGLRGR